MQDIKHCQIETLITLLTDCQCPFTIVNIMNNLYNISEQKTVVYQLTDNIAKCSFSQHSAEQNTQQGNTTQPSSVITH